MSVQDVFAAPKSSVRDVSGGSGVITDSIVAAMRKTRPWVLFLAIFHRVYGGAGAGLPLVQDHGQRIPWLSLMAWHCNACQSVDIASGTIR